MIALADEIQCYNSGEVRFDSICNPGTWVLADHRMTPLSVVTIKDGNTPPGSSSLLMNQVKTKKCETQFAVTVFNERRLRVGVSACNGER